jgi:hypothetical protein
MFGKIIQHIRNKRFLNQSLSGVEKNEYVPSEGKSSRLHVFTVTYNNSSLLEHQINLMRKYLEDSFVLVVADNSTNTSIRKDIQKICSNNKVGYIGLPKNPFTTSSRSHAICLNWIWKNYIKSLKPEFFGFIDHDIYPVEKHSLISKIEKNGLYGHVQGNELHWYLWAGFSFFSWTKVKNVELDFSPCTVEGVNLDTGGGNWEQLYSTLDKGAMDFPSHMYIKLREGEVAQSDKMELIGEWLHSFNGSYWMNVNPKEDAINDYLKKYY